MTFMSFALSCSEQTAHISLYSVHWLTFITECVYCAVRAESSNIIQLCHVSGCSSPACKGGSPVSIPGQSMWSIVGRRSTGTDFPASTRFYPATMIPPMSHTDFQPHAFPTRRTRGRSLGNLVSLRSKRSLWDRSINNRLILHAHASCMPLPDFPSLS